MIDIAASPAGQTAEKVQACIYECINNRRSFLLEAGAGAGKTYSLIKALKYLINNQGTALLRRNQQVACITYTNVAKDEIEARTDGHPAILSSTIHAFCWATIKDFQGCLRDELPKIHNWWSEELEKLGGIGTRRIGYDDFGRRSVDETCVSLHHDDVLSLTIKLMANKKFRRLLVGRYPILFIDEYQDTDNLVAEALTTYFLNTSEISERPLIGFFGDHWQKIYGNGCGKIEHQSLQVINKESNFRSVPIIVKSLNRIRPELPQQVVDPEAQGSVAVFHTNQWIGNRRTETHWAGDLPADIAHKHLEALKTRLNDEGWDFSPDKTKILMLTHNVLAGEQGYFNLANVFPYNDSFIKKGDPHIKFFVDTLEPVCIAYENKRYGEMFDAMGRHTPAIRSHADKAEWANKMDDLLSSRATGTVGDVLDLLRRTRRPCLPEDVERSERKLEELESSSGTEEPFIDRLRRLREIRYQEVMALYQFINGYTPFSTKHGVKGAQFENVLVVFGRGWNQYDFNQFLEWAGSPNSVPSAKKNAFERNRNLFYVVCSRPQKRLALLFTQKLTAPAIATLTTWFGEESICSLNII